MELSIFEIYRQLLGVVVGTYCVVRVCSVVMHWQGFGRDGDRVNLLIRRYAVSLFLRGRFRQFWLESVQIVLLAGMLVYLMSQHR